MRVTLTSQSLEWLGDHRIFLDRRGVRRLAPGDLLEFLEAAEVEPYVAFLAGRGLCAAGFMSFSNSPVSPKLQVGRYCSIGPEVSSHHATHPVEHVSTSTFTHDLNDVLARSFAADHDLTLEAFPFQQRPHVVIEHDVWIGARSLILPGVTLGTGAVVAAGSIVTRTVGPYEVVAGNPARVVRKRFPDELAAGLLASEWWRYRPDDFAGLPLDDPPRFLAGFLDRKADLEPYQPARARLGDMPHEA